VPGFSLDRFLGEPAARDTLNAVGFGAAVIAGRDPEQSSRYSLPIISSSHREFREIVEHGFRLAEQHANTLVTFGITPTAPSTAYGYLQLAD